MSDTVTVACKLPHGLILQLQRPVKMVEPVLGGGVREYTISQRFGEQVTIFGNRTPFGQQPKCTIIGDYALTPGIDKTFFEEWMKQNANHDVVVNELIFAHKSRDHAEGFARENAGRRSGLEPLDMSMKTVGGKERVADPRVPGNITKAS